ncbi:MAG: S41 family peptidase [Ardenticatenaceae bacterium]|nr:S41 family peptidase [Ardenticatenaceae bacterium]
MKSRFLTTMLIIAFAFIGLNIGYVWGQSSLAPIQVFQAADAAQPDTFAPFWEVWSLVHTRYYEQPVDDVALTQGAIEGMLAALGDQHTRYLSPQDELAARERMSGEFQGIGAEIESADGKITIVSPLDGSPALAAGLQPGDILREADGVVLTGMDVSEAAALVRGPAGTTVSLLIERGDETFTVDIVRDVILLSSVRSEMLADNIAYLRLSQFGDQSADEIETQLSDLLAQNPVGLILDLRRNPGGGLNTAVSIADQFLPEGTILVEQFGDGEATTFAATAKGIAEDIPLVVLIDEGSASASEVLAGAIQDRQRGVLIGTTSFGKGTVQTWHALSDGGGVRITIARWLTPDENWVHETGLEPDYYISLPDVENGAEFTDTQLQAAVDYLLGNPVISVPPTDDE